MKINLQQYNWYNDLYTDKQTVKIVKSIKVVKSQKPVKSK